MSQHDTNTDTEPFDTTTAEDAQLLLADPDDYHRAQRLRDIHAARRDVRRVLNEIVRYVSDSDHHRQQLNLSDAVTAYISELEPLIEATDYDDSLERGPWDNLRHYADLMGRYPEDARDSRQKNQQAGYEVSTYIYRQCNSFLAEVKPLMEPEDNDTWEV